MKDLKVAIIQSDLIWENPEKNLKRFDEKIDSILEQPNLILLPEMFNTAFSINPDKCAETINGYTFNWLKNKAEKSDSVIAGSLLISENNKYYNRLFWMQPNGEYLYYDKRHLFRMSDEFKIFNKGDKRSIVELNGWKINLNICYDLRFPVWSRNTFKDGIYEYDILINLANWPESRSIIWQTLLKARAIENQSYVIGVNRIGRDGFDTPHSGDSMIVDPLGNLLVQATPNEEAVITQTLSYDLITDFRKKFTVGYDWDLFEIKN